MLIDLIAKDIRVKNYDVIIIAGQSNAEGNGRHTAEDKEIKNDRVFQLVDANPARIFDNDKGETVLDIKMPVETRIEFACERKCGEEILADFSETFAAEYIKGGNLKENRNILIVKAAVGGAGFAKKQWGVGNPLSDRLFAMVDHALSLNSENRIAALLWHQGEHDAFENADLPADERYTFYYNNFYRQMNAVRERYNKFSFPIVAGEFVPTWKWGLQNKEKVDAIYRAMRLALDDLGNGGFISSEGLKSNDEAIGNGDDIHFCAGSIYELGRRYYRAFSNIKKNES